MRFAAFFLALMTAAAGYGQGMFSKLTVPNVPSELEFAGERVPLENFDVFEGLQREMLVTLYMHSRTTLTLLNTTRYFPVIEPILARYGVPDDFKYLCMAESGLNPNITSPAGAAGLWQIMSATGKEYGLLVEKGVDERFDIEKSTEAACKYLLDSYKRFGSWTLAAAAYNLGNAGVSRRLEIQGEDDYYDVFLPEETMRYVYRILSLKLLSREPYSYGYIISLSDYYKPLNDYTTVEVSDKEIEWSEVAHRNGTTYKMLRQLNHWIRDYQYNNASGRTFKVKIPGEGFRRNEP
ncbi:MAG: lytic transglycosylase domain-containing protein [Rikenellaceae bacterium]|nr:lytic transglycosylase domain-containing protein [Rikenellaceae bacterium]